MELYIILGVIAVLAVYIVIVYNGLISLKNRVENGWAQIETQLQRRFDLIPNLVETVKGYAEHEKEVFENVTRARANLENAGSVADKATADNALTGTLKSLFAVAENYPDLKANENFRELQLELTGTENKIAFARQFYNDMVAKFNIAIEVFPKNIIASMCKFTKKEYYESKDEAKDPVQVKF